MSLETSPELGFLEFEIHSEWYSKTFEELLRYIFTQRSHIPTDDSAYGLTVIDNHYRWVLLPLTVIVNRYNRLSLSLTVTTVIVNR